ncbi:PREDICTED: PDZ domain-containing protein 9 [Chaetura pelagica]|uniref:PDZ domain-containing protein 9 n=1 Tax=Chaetura pelagica TaxID=8897 RepID=UPI00052369EC|nr:PREDICTED: PDZ domain-containing protein 9 [Chaetura pelagica]
MKWEAVLNTNIPQVSTFVHGLSALAITLYNVSCCGTALEEGLVTAALFARWNCKSKHPPVSSRAPPRGQERDCPSGLFLAQLHGKRDKGRRGGEGTQKEALPLDSMEHAQHLPAAGDETKGQLPALENVSQHTLIAALKANIRMSEQGLGLIIIQNGPYLQITSLVEKSSAANDGKLKPGDVLIKIGHANVLGWTLQDLSQLLHSIPIGNTLQIRVYRDFLEIPQHWQSALELIPEVKFPEMAADTGEDEDEEDTRSSSDDDVDLETAVSNTGQTLREATSTGCDAVLPNDIDALCNPKFDASGVRAPSNWASKDNETSCSSSCSSVSDTSYLEEFVSE